MPLHLDRRYRLGDACGHVRWQRICDLCDKEREEARCAITQGGDEVDEVVEVVEGPDGGEMWGLCFDRDAGEDVYQSTGDIKDFLDLGTGMSDLDLAIAWGKSLPGQRRGLPLLALTAGL